MHNAIDQIFLIVDGCPEHRLTLVKKFVKSTKARLRLLNVGGKPKKKDEKEKDK